MTSHMHPIVFGLRHQQTPLSVRERFAFSLEELQVVLNQLVQGAVIQEAAILSTCNRIEVYAVTSHPEAGFKTIQQFLSQYKELPLETFAPYGVCLAGQQAAEHLFKVASGLDSMVLGEDQIMGQVKEAYKTSIKARSIGPVLQQLFKQALQAAKAVRTETGIAQRDISIAKAAFEFVQTHFNGFFKRPVAVVGGGKMAEILLGCLTASLPVGSNAQALITVVNRHYERAEELAQIYNVSAQPWEALTQVVAQADTLFVATGSPHIILDSTHFIHAPRPKVVVDIAVPRNVDPVVGQYNGIDLFNTDHLAGFSGFSGQHQQRLIEEANQIIERYSNDYVEWQQQRHVAPLIVELREHFEEIRQTELSSLVLNHPTLAEHAELLDTWSSTLMNKLLHGPVMQLKAMALELPKPLPNTWLQETFAHETQVLALQLSNPATVIDALPKLAERHRQENQQRLTHLVGA